MTNKTCKKCKGIGKVPTYEKQNTYGGIDFSGPKFVICIRCHGRGSIKK